MRSPFSHIKVKYATVDVIMLTLAYPKIFPNKPLDTDTLLILSSGASRDRVLIHPIFPKIFLFVNAKTVVHIRMIAGMTVMTPIQKRFEDIRIISDETHILRRMEKAELEGLMYRGPEEIRFVSLQVFYTDGTYSIFFYGTASILQELFWLFQ